MNTPSISSSPATLSPALASLVDRLLGIQAAPVAIESKSVMFHYCFEGPMSFDDEDEAA
jgi:hypothetical protein